jgi:hypothetical protein
MSIIIIPDYTIARDGQNYAVLVPIFDFNFKTEGNILFDSISAYTANNFKIALNCLRNRLVNREEFDFEELENCNIGEEVRTKAIEMIDHGLNFLVDKTAPWDLKLPEKPSYDEQMAIIDFAGKTKIINPTEIDCYKD